jgi:hypothetical protein
LPAGLQQLHTQLIETPYLGHRRQVRPPGTLGKVLDVALLVTSPNAAEPRLVQIPTLQLLKPAVQAAILTSPHRDYRRLQVVVRQTLRDAAEILKRPHMTVQERLQIGPLIGPDERRFRVAQPHAEKLRLALYPILD